MYILIFCFVSRHVVCRFFRHDKTIVGWIFCLLLGSGTFAVFFGGFRLLTYFDEYLRYTLLKRVHESPIGLYFQSVVSAV